MSMTVIFRMPADKADILDYYADIKELRQNLQALLTDKDVVFIESGDVCFDLGTHGGRIEADVEIVTSKEVYVTFYTGSEAFTIRTRKGYEVSFTVVGHKLLINKCALFIRQAVNRKEKEIDIDKCLEKMYERLSQAERNYKRG